MEIGVRAPAAGRLATPSAVRAIARAAEQVGYASLWAIDRPDRAAASAGRWLDAALVLASSAACTDVVRLGWEVDVSRRADALEPLLSSLAVLADGRLSLGLGPDGDHLDAVVDALPAEWRTGSAGSAGSRAPDRPHLLLEATTPCGLERVGRVADGWLVRADGIDELSAGWERVREAATTAGRDPALLRLVVRADLDVLASPAGRDRSPFRGSFDEVLADLDAVRSAGAHELVLGLVGDVGVDEVLGTYARVAEALETAARLARARRHP